MEEEPVEEEPLESKEELETDEEAIAQAEAKEFRNKAKKVEERADEIRRKANWYPPSDEDDRDYADERKLEIYGSRVDEVESTVNLHAKGRQKQKLEKLVTVSLRLIVQVRVKDKEVQTSLQHIVLPKVRGQIEQVKFFAHMCKTLEANTPPYRSFWRFYYNKKLQRKSVPIIHWHTNLQEDLKRSIAEGRIRNARLEGEPWTIMYGDGLEPDELAEEAFG
ncbi:unnamed protein product [Sphagnum jensenii]|uniref:Uncharacterized protein n=1 Tax=Sphagnum jensenii TaxID=128206 RepID=A0ABP1BGY4_9BRYO